MVLRGAGVNNLALLDRCSRILRYLSNLVDRVAAVANVKSAPVSLPSRCVIIHLVTSPAPTVFQISVSYIKALCISSALLLTQPALAAVEDNTVLALDPREGIIVVETAAGTMEVITIGDAFPDSEVVVVQVLADKVVAEEVVGGDKKVRQQVWVYKAENAASGSRVERLLLSLPQDATLVPNTINTHVLESNSQEVIQ